MSSTDACGWAKRLPESIRSGWIGDDEMTHRSLSQHNLEEMKHEARELLHDLRRQDATALIRQYSLDREGGAYHPRLADAQYVIAREYGFTGWRKLQERLVTNR